MKQREDFLDAHQLHHPDRRRGELALQHRRPPTQRARLNPFACAKRGGRLAARFPSRHASTPRGLRVLGHRRSPCSLPIGLPLKSGGAFLQATPINHPLVEGYN